MPIYMCFVDLEKAYDWVPREILWEVLREYGVRKLSIDLRSYPDLWSGRKGDDRKNEIAGTSGQDIVFSGGWLATPLGIG